MAVIELPSTKNLKYPDVYKYVPSEKLKGQTVHIILENIGTDSFNKLSSGMYKTLFNFLAKEYGVFTLGRYQYGCSDWITSYVPRCDASKFIDLVYLFLALIKEFQKERYYVGSKYDDVVSEFNERMKRDGFGYEIIDGEFIRVDSMYAHNEIVKPSLFILEKYPQAKQYFLQGHKLYRESKYPQAIVECNKCFECIMKEILSELNIAYPEKITNQQLIALMLDNSIIPSSLSNELSNYRKMLDEIIKSGVPTIRNQNAHANISGPDNSEGILAKYAINLTASNVLFFDDCAQEFKNR